LFIFHLAAANDRALGIPEPFQVRKLISDRTPCTWSPIPRMD
jgi:hypothetical protein